MAVLEIFIAQFSVAEEKKFKILSEEQLAKNLESMCGFKLTSWFGEAPPKSIDLTGKKSVIREMPPIFSKQFDKKYYEIMAKQKALKLEKTYGAAKKSEAKLNEELNSLISETEFFGTCQKISKKVASECVKNQESQEEFKKCLLFHQNKFDILDRHNSHIMDIPELKKKTDTAAGWLEE